MSSAARLPTYKTAAEVLERDKGSGVRLAGWTVARTLLIAPPMMMVGIPARQAFLGAALASSLISVFTLLRLFDAQKTGLAGVQPHLRRLAFRRPASRPRRLAAGRR